MIAAAGYIPNVKIPDYKDLIKKIEKVRSITDKIQETPAHLYK
jgi:hypothetical protein